MSQNSNYPILCFCQDGRPKVGIAELMERYKSGQTHSVSALHQLSQVLGFQLDLKETVTTGISAYYVLVLLQPNMDLYLAPAMMRERYLIVYYDMAEKLSSHNCSLLLFRSLPGQLQAVVPGFCLRSLPD